MRVHDKGAATRDRLIDRLACNQQEPASFTLAAHFNRIAIAEDCKIPSLNDSGRIGAISCDAYRSLDAIDEGVMRRWYAFSEARRVR